MSMKGKMTCIYGESQTVEMLRESSQNILKKQLRKVISESFKAGESNVFDPYDILFVEDTPKLEKYRSDMEKHQKAFGRIIYEQYLHKLIKDLTNQIFQERPSLP